MSICAIKQPQLLHFGASCGANQEWYPLLWQRQAGCGPTNCAQLIYYLAKTRHICPLTEIRAADGSVTDASGAMDTRAGFLALMQEVWRYVTPGRMGVNTTDILANGAVRYGADRGVALRADVLNIPARTARRPPAADALRFVCRALERDLPVAFLNLSSGQEARLDSWHWVTLVSLSAGERSAARMYDQEQAVEIDLALWLGTTRLGGGFVTLSPAAENA